MPTIRVVVRFRPINRREKDTAEENNWTGKQICPLYVDEKHLLSFSDIPEEEKIGRQVRCAPPKVAISMQPKFAFDEILVWVNQNTAYQRIGLPVVTDALNGINGTIFAYGQTGSGKTFSMFGPEPLTEENGELLGVIPRCCAQIFDNLSTDPTVKAYRIDVSFFEIYIHNTIRDLLHPAKKGDPPLKVRDGPKGVFIEHLVPETATNLSEILSLIALANSHRTVSSTKMNATSSRSHSVMRVNIRVERKDGSRVKSQINFGDLAGSEKVGKTGATGQTLREAQAINQSLTMLGNVIAALAKIGSGKKTTGSMVPFRDCALTHVLKDSLSGNCKTTLVTAASPHKFNLVETISTFRFGSRCKLVKTKAEKNVVLSSGQMRKMIASLKVEIKSLKMQLMQGGGGGGSSLGGIGVNITWPSDFQKWTTDKKLFGVLKKQVNKQIKEVLQTSVANNSDDVEHMPYVISLSAIGTKRKVVIQFRCDDEDEDGDYDRETCINLSKKLASAIDKINKKSLLPALKHYKVCKAFSEPAAGELKEVIEKQKLQITLLSERYSTAQQEVQDKNAEIENLQTSVGNLDNASVRNKSEFTGGLPQHYKGNFTGGTSMVNVPDLFGQMQRASSIFQGGKQGKNSLRVADLLSQLLHSKYEVLRSKRSLQLLQVRYASEEKKMSQLRYIISRMQSEFMDLKATSLVSKAVLSNVAETHLTNDGSQAVTLSLKRQFSLNSGLMNSDETDFIEGALDDIMNNMDADENGGGSRSGSRKNSVSATPSLIRKISNLAGMHRSQTDRDSQNSDQPRALRARSNTYHRNARSGRQRRASAGPSGHMRNSSMGQKRNALGHYNYGQRKNNLPNQIFQDNNKAKKFGATVADYLQKQSTNRKELLHDMISASETGDIGADEKEQKMKNANDFIPNVAFDDTEKLWRGYDKEWIKKWRTSDVCKWVKKIYGGRMRRYVKHFKKKKIDGRRLLDLQMPDLLDLHLIRTEAIQILAFTDSISDPISDEDDDAFGSFFDDLDDFDEFFDDGDVDDFFADDHDGNDGATIRLKRSTSAWSVDDVADVERYSDEEEIRGDPRFYDDPTLRLTDLMIEQLTSHELAQVQKLPLFKQQSSKKSISHTECTNFSRIKEFYHDYSQVLLLTLYGLLCNKIGLLYVYEWNDLLNAAKNIDIKIMDDKKTNSDAGIIDTTHFDDHSVIINSFVDFYPIYSEFSDHETGKLTAEGGKHFVSSLRQSMEEANDLRDDEDGVEFFAGLRIDEMQEFVSKLANKLWSLINNPLEIEYVYRQIRLKCSQNVTPDRLDRCIAEIGAKFVSPNMIQESIKEMNLIPNPTITLDVWIKKLFIKGYDEEHATESVLNELILLNGALEMKYFKQQRLELMARHSAGSQAADDLNLSQFQGTQTIADEMMFGSDYSSDGGDYNHAQEKDVAWVPTYLDLNKLLHDVGQFGTCGKCQGFLRIPSSRFSASSVLHKKTSSAKRCRLNSKYGWSANYENNDQIHWIQVDLGKVTTCFAVAVQGGAGVNNEWITKAILTSCNNYNAKDPSAAEWKKVQLTGDSNGKIACNDSQTVQVYMFARWIKARYIRLNIYKYNGAPSVRWDILFGDLKIDNIDDIFSM